jgi:hypothetical protein
MWTEEQVKAIKETIEVWKEMIIECRKLHTMDKYIFMINFKERIAEKVLNRHIKHGCPLCEKFLDEKSQSQDVYCGNCPINIFYDDTKLQIVISGNGTTRCEMYSPYSHFYEQWNHRVYSPCENDAVNAEKFVKWLEETLLKCGV